MQNDVLTGLGTHTAFMLALSKSVEEAARHGTHLTALFMDLDNFRKYNEVYDHVEGDVLLRRVARMLESEMGSEDSAYRMGCDEFAVLLSDTTKADAQRKAERIRNEVAQAFAGEPAVTISIGLATYPVDSNSAKDLWKALDDALYMSKRGGRNRVSLSKTFEERLAPPIVIEGDWDHPHPAKRDPPSPDLDAGNAKKLGE